ncbi:DUF721 domain-containing protein [Patescibacteria group bacterium]|nr:DUF721 domain-containing protein [Patescibacteria group bacterium]MBU1035000.1 DUF721 domain-containing protein [Patescibacteria group bacterium]MBU1908098.1 DUF721 domain-containing protein [Patescibacteria group bacterium]
MAFQPIKKILTSVMQSHSFSGKLQAYRVLETAKEVLQNLWDEERAAYINPLSFKEGKLKCVALSPSAKQQLSLEQTRYMNEINRRLNGRVVFSLQIIGKGF